MKSKRLRENVKKKRKKLKKEQQKKKEIKSINTSKNNQSQYIESKLKRLNKNKKVKISILITENLNTDRKTLSSS